MVKPRVWIETGIILTYGSNLDATPHSHHAIQIIWPGKETECLLNGVPIEQLTIIDSGQEHRLQMKQGWVLLVEPNSALGEALKSRLNGLTLVSVNSTFAGPFNSPANNIDAFELLVPMFSALELNIQLLSINPTAVKDSRIKQLLAELDQCFMGTCIKPANWRASEVAQQLNLSESRFLHIFSQQMGIAWRPYLLWRRMMCAMQALLKGTSATDAAYLAGFSDSAHLSRTFRNAFGMTIRQANTLLKQN